jgi:hypothetical protein
VLTQGPRTLHRVKEKEIVQLPGDLALLVKEEHPHSQLAQVQFPHDEVKDFLSDDKATVATNRNSSSKAELAASKQPVAVSFAWGRRLRWIVDHFGDVAPPEACPE